MEFKNTFVEGKMNKDLDERLLPKSQYRHAENIKVIHSEGAEVGAIENSLGNKKLVEFNFGTNPKTIGAVSDSFDDKIYWWVLSDTGSFVVEYDVNESVFVLVLHDTRAGALNILNLDEFHLITGANVLVNSDDNSRFLAWTDDINPPRFINIERAKAYGENGFDNEDISLVKAPPLDPPSINLSSTPTDKENNIEERFLRFSHRYIYLDGEHSPLSAFTETAFKAMSFSYDFSTSTNESMINAFSRVNISFNTGSKLIKGIDIVFKESGSDAVYLVNSFDKSDEGWTDNQSVNFDFDNNKLYNVLPHKQLFRLFDAVPLKAKAQELIGNRLMFGNYVENYDISDCDGVNIPIVFTLDKISTAITEGVATESLKSNRDYEIGIVYSDDAGRMTTVLDSNNNTIYIPNADSINQNQIKVILENKAPCFANKYRFFIKQSKIDYDTIVPTLFYQDGTDVWIKLEGDEINKITEGEFLFVKADTQEVLNEIIQTRVLEIKTQPENFLEEDTVTTLEQVAGTYFRVKPSGYRLNEDDFTHYEFSSYDSSSNANDNPIRGEVNAIEKASYYGTSGINDLTESGTYTGLTDIRYLVEIDSVGGTDTFRWSDDDGGTWTSTVAITGAAQVLNNGVQITFGATTGHGIADEWVVSAKSTSDNNFGGSENSKAYAIFKSLESNGEINVDDVIEGGARISITYDEYNETTEFVDKTYVSSRKYDNLEEWFYKENIISDFGGIVDSRIWFRRGVTASNGGAKYFTQDATGDMCLIIRSSGTQNNDLESRVKVRSDLEIFQLEQNIIFETKPLNDNTQFFYEIGRTYDIDASQNHLGFDGSDVDQTDIVNAELILPVFNCFAWGNAFESYKVKDLFNATSFKIDSRTSSIIEDYRENHRIASLTYSEPYEQSTNYNGINEFNLSEVNFKDLDDKYNSIQKLYSEDTNLIVFQEDKVHNVLFNKNILFNADGTGNVSQTANVLGQEVAYTGAYGISKNPESFAAFGSRKYFTDVRRGCVLRLSNDGITRISDNGMIDFFKDEFRTNSNTKKLGAYDVYTNQYVLHIDDTELPDSATVPCGVLMNVFELAETMIFDMTFEASTGDLRFDYDISVGSISIKVTEGGVPTDYGTKSGVGNVDYTKLDDDITEVTVEISPITTTPVFSFSMVCPIDLVDPVVANDDAVLVITGTEVDNINVLINDVFVDPVTVVITVPPSDGIAVVNPNKTIKYTHDGLLVQPDTLTYEIDDGSTTDTASVNFSVKATGGGAGPTGEEFSISTDSYFNPSTDGEGACGFTVDDTKYHDGGLLEPIIGDNVFVDVNKTTPFNGGDKYYRIGGGISIRIFTDGSITGYWVCGAGEA